MKPVAFVDVENCTNFQLSGEADEYEAIYIACHFDTPYPILEQTKGLPQVFCSYHTEAQKNKADDHLFFFLTQALARFNGHPVWLYTNDKKLRARFQSACHKAETAFHCCPFKFYKDHIGMIIHELTKMKKKARPDSTVDLGLFIQAIFDDIETYHLSPTEMRRRLAKEGLISVKDNFVLYNF